MLNVRINWESFKHGRKVASRRAFLQNLIETKVLVQSGNLTKKDVGDQAAYTYRDLATIAFDTDVIEFPTEDLLKTWDNTVCENKDNILVLS